MLSRLWATIEKWAPAATSGICLLVVIVVGWLYSSRLAYLDGVNNIQQRQLEHQDEMHKQELLQLRAERKQEIDSLKAEVNGIRNWSIAVYERVSQVGIVLPKPPKEEKDE